MRAFLTKPELMMVILLQRWPDSFSTQTASTTLRRIGESDPSLSKNPFTPLIAFMEGANLKDGQDRSVIC